MTQQPSLKSFPNRVYLFAHVVNDFQVLRVGQKHVRVHSDVIVQKRHHVCNTNIMQYEPL